MAMVMIKCPKTGETVATGHDTEPEYFNSLATTMSSSVLQNCPSCGETHQWSKSVAFLENSAPV